MAPSADCKSVAPPGSIPGLATRRGWNGYTRAGSCDPLRSPVPVRLRTPRRGAVTIPRVGTGKTATSPAEETDASKALQAGFESRVADHTKRTTTYGTS